MEFFCVRRKRKFRRHWKKIFKKLRLNCQAFEKALASFASHQQCLLSTDTIAVLHCCVCILTPRLDSGTKTLVVDRLVYPRYSMIFVHKKAYYHKFLNAAHFLVSCGSASSSHFLGGSIYTANIHSLSHKHLHVVHPTKHTHTNTHTHVLAHTHTIQSLQKLWCKIQYLKIFPNF